MLDQGYVAKLKKEFHSSLREYLVLPNETIMQVTEECGGINVLKGTHCLPIKDDCYLVFSKRGRGFNLFLGIPKNDNSIEIVSSHKFQLYEETIRKKLSDFVSKLESEKMEFIKNQGTKIGEVEPKNKEMDITNRLIRDGLEEILKIYPLKKKDPLCSVYSFLYVLYRGVKEGDIAKLLNPDVGSLKSYLNLFEDRGLVTSEDHVTDKGKMYLEIYPELLKMLFEKRPAEESSPEVLEEFIDVKDAHPFGKRGPLCMAYAILRTLAEHPESSKNLIETRTRMDIYKLEEYSKILEDAKLADVENREVKGRGMMFLNKYPELLRLLLPRQICDQWEKVKLVKNGQTAQTKIYKETIVGG